MAIITKRYTETGTDGTTELFQAPQEYITGSLWVWEDGTFRKPTDIGGGFYQLSPAPAGGTELNLMYDVEEVNSAEEDGLLPWELKNLNALLDAMKLQQEAMGNMDNSLQERITRDDFDSWANIIEQEIKNLKSTLITS